jgi:hypothetical protein
VKVRVKTGRSWWEGLDDDAFRKRQKEEQPRMNQNKEGRAWLSLSRQLSGGRPYSPPRIKG